MSYSPIIQNIVHPLFSLSSQDTRDISVLYDHRNSMFDKFIEKYIDISLTHKNSYEIIQKILSYDVYWDNNPVEYISNYHTYKDQHILDIVFFHDWPENVLKKEDKFILQNRLQNSLQIYTNESFKNEWTINNGKYIPYGIPDTRISLEQPRKSVVLINTDNGRSGEILYSHIKQYFPDAGMMHDISVMSYDNIIDSLREFSICITLKKSFDSLIALSCGCDVLSSSFLSENGVTHIEDFNQIHIMIESALNSRNLEIIKQRTRDLIKKYDLEIFQSEIYNTIRNRIRKPFIL
jgi:hypothetical protein